MKMPFKMPRLKGFRFPREVIAYAVWVYHRFALSTADVEDLLAERGVTVSRETIRQWVNRFGRQLHQARPASRGRQMAFGWVLPSCCRELVRYWQREVHAAISAA